jgi:hypothetical protein
MYNVPLLFAEIALPPAVITSTGSEQLLASDLKRAAFFHYLQSQWITEQYDHS